MAKRLQLPFYDADAVLEEREQRTIKAFFAESE
ncbi:shikimate kinase, partial [Phascolarctobacterium succinatutens]